MLGAEVLHDLRQQVQDGRAVGGDIEFAGIQPTDLFAEAAVQPVQAFDQRLGQFVQQLALAGGGQAAPATLEQADAQLPFQRLQLQGNGRLADLKRLRSPRNRPQTHGLAESPQRLQAV
jgi:hypothetical protein